MLRRKTLLDYTNLFFPKDYEKNDKITYKYSKANMPEEASLQFRLRKVDKTRNYLLEQINNNDLISQKYKKTCKFLNYVE